MKMMKVYTSVSRRLLDLYNRTMDAHGEDIYMIEVGDIHDCEADILADNAWNEANPVYDADGKYPDSYVVDAAYLVEEMRYNLVDKQGDMMREAVESGEMTRKRRDAMRRANNLAVSRFMRAAADDVREATPWLVGEVEVAG